MVHAKQVYKIRHTGGSWAYRSWCDHRRNIYRWPNNYFPCASKKLLLCRRTNTSELAMVFINFRETARVNLPLYARWCLPFSFFHFFPRSLRWFFKVSASLEQCKGITAKLVTDRAPLNYGICLVVWFVVIEIDDDYVHEKDLFVIVPSAFYYTSRNLINTTL